jgi:hypothetical protein
MQQHHPKHFENGGDIGKEDSIGKGYKLQRRLLVPLPRAIAQAPLRRAAAQLLLHQHLVQARGVPAVVAEQTLAAQQRPDGHVRERTLCLPTNRASKRLCVAEVALRLSQGVCGQRLSARAAGERDGVVSGHLLVDGGERRVAELA